MFSKERGSTCVEVQLETLVPRGRTAAVLISHEQEGAHRERAAEWEAERLLKAGGSTITEDAFDVAKSHFHRNKGRLVGLHFRG